MPSLTRSQADELTVLAELLAVTPVRQWPALAGCVAWVESAGRRCGRERGTGWLCARHHGVALRRREAQVARNGQRAERALVEAQRRAPEVRSRLERVEAEIRRLDLPAPTDDLAAYGGRGSSAASRYRARYTPERIHRLAELHATAEQVRRRLPATSSAVALSSQ